MTVHDDHIRATLLALRQLPPGTRLSEPSDPEVAALLADVRRLPAEIELPSWAARDHAELCSRVALRAQIDAAQDVIAGIKRASAAGVPLGDATTTLAPLGDFDWEPSVSNLTVFGDTLGGSIDDMARTLDIWRQSGLSPLVRDWADETGFVVLARALEASPSDPVEWIKEHHLDQAVSTALTLVAVLATADLSLDIGPPKHQITSRHCHRLAELTVCVRSVVLGQEGVLVHGEVISPTPGTRHGPRAVIEGITRPATQDAGTGPNTWPRVEPAPVWEQGFQSLTDDLGHAYVPARFQSDSPRDSGGWRTSTFQQSFFPALASGAGAVEITAPGYQRIWVDTEDRPGLILGMQDVSHPVTFRIPLTIS
jgi:hypothetical protein